MREVLIAIILGIILMQVGCNTMHGMGQDVKQGGEKIEDISH